MTFDPITSWSHTGTATPPTERFGEHDALTVARHVRDARHRPRRWWPDVRARLRLPARSRARTWATREYAEPADTPIAWSPEYVET